MSTAGPFTEDPARIRALAAAINAGKTSSDYRALGFVSRSAAISRARDLGFHFGQAVTPAMLDHALAPKPAAIRATTTQRIIPMDDQSPVRALAAECLTEHRIVQNALPPLVDRVMADHELREEAIRELVSAHCERILTALQQQAYQEEKRKSGGGPLAQKRQGPMNLAAHADAVALSLMDTFTLPGGKKLGDATRPDLVTAMSSYEISEADLRTKRLWLRLIQQSVTPGKTVRDCLTDQRLAELRDEARREAGKVAA